jgi:hypothetical protein
MPGIILPDRMADPLPGPATMGPPPWYQTDEAGMAMAAAVFLLFVAIAWRGGLFGRGRQIVGDAGASARPYWREIAGLMLLSSIAAGVWL